MPNPRMSITFTEPQMEFLAKEAKRLAIPIADLVRRIVDLHRDIKPMGRFLERRLKP